MALTFANNSSLANITALPASITGGALTLLSTQTASASASIEFTSGLDSTYDSYVFKLINIHPATDQVGLNFNFSIDNGSNYNVTKTTTMFRAFHNEADSDTSLQYETNHDLAQSTDFQKTDDTIIGNDNDQNLCSIIHIFNPSSSTFVKHFIVRTANITYHDYITDTYVAGYCNTTSPINAIKFQMSSGNIDDGIIKMYGVS